jgi:ABC-type branched-subunit amino acid transport system substrate-binding protein
LRFSADFIIVAGPEAGRAIVVQRAGEATEGLIWVSSVLPAAADALPLPFVSGYQALAGGLPGPNAILAYDATNVLLDAIELDIIQNSHPTRQGVMAALPAIHVEGLSGDIRFDDQGSWLQAPIFAYRIAGDDIFAQPQLLTAGR